MTYIQPFTFYPSPFILLYPYTFKLFILSHPCLPCSLILSALIILYSVMSARFSGKTSKHLLLLICTLAKPGISENRG